MPHYPLLLATSPPLPHYQRFANLWRDAGLPRGEKTPNKYLTVFGFHRFCKGYANFWAQLYLSIDHVESRLFACSFYPNVASKSLAST